MYIHGLDGATEMHSSSTKAPIFVAILLQFVGFRPTYALEI